MNQQYPARAWHGSNSFFIFSIHLVFLEALLDIIHVAFCKFHQYVDNF